MGGRAPRLYYITQAETAPPVFVIIASSPDAVHFSYQRFVANQLRKHFDFDGVPIRIVYRERRRGGKGRKEAAAIEAGPAPAPKTGRRPAPGDTAVPRKPPASRRQRRRRSREGRRQRPRRAPGASKKRAARRHPEGAGAHGRRASGAPQVRQAPPPLTAVVESANTD